MQRRRVLSKSDYNFALAPIDVGKPGAVFRVRVTHRVYGRHGDAVFTHKGDALNAIAKAEGMRCANSAIEYLYRVACSQKR